MSNSPLVDYTKISPNRTIGRGMKIDTITIHCVVGQLSAESIGSCFATKSKRASSNYGIGFDGRIGMYVEEKDTSWCSSSYANDRRAVTIECACDREPPYKINEAVYKSLIKLVTDICKRNNIKELKWKADKKLIGHVDKQNMTVHRWFAKKSCPGDYIYNRLDKIADEVNAKLHPKENNTPSTHTTEKKNETVKNEYDLKDFKNDLCNDFNTTKDQIKDHTVTVSIDRKNDVKLIKHLQKRLRYLGYAVGEIDGIVGPKFVAAVKKFQSDRGCVSDGIITKGKKTWNELLKDK